MILKGKIQNKKELSELFLQLMAESPATAQSSTRSSFVLKNISCLLCFRFLVSPVQHPECGQTYCRDCLFAWVEYLGYCPNCKLDLAPEVVSQYEINSNYRRLTQLIKIACRLNSCENSIIRPIKSLSVLPIIDERSFDEESLEKEQTNKNFFSSFFKKDEKKKINNSRRSYSLDITQSYFDNNSKSFNGSSINLSHDNSTLGSGKNHSKRTFSVNDYVLHLIRQHAWPSLEIRVDKTANKIYYVGYNPDQNLSKISELSQGPGVEHICSDKTNIWSIVGVYKNGELLKEVKIYQTGRLIFKGNMINRLFEKYGVRRYYLIIDDEKLKLVSTKDSNKKYKAFLQYQGSFSQGKAHGKGVLYFMGNYCFFKTYFEKIANDKKLIMDKLKEKQEDPNERFLESLGKKGTLSRLKFESKNCRHFSTLLIYIVWEKIHYLIRI